MTLHLEHINLSTACSADQKQLLECNLVLVSFNLIFRDIFLMGAGIGIAAKAGVVAGGVAALLFNAGPKRQRRWQHSFEGDGKRLLESSSDRDLRPGPRNKKKVLKESKFMESNGRREVSQMQMFAEQSLEIPPSSSNSNVQMREDQSLKVPPSTNKQNMQDFSRKKNPVAEKSLNLGYEENTRFQAPSVGMSKRESTLEFEKSMKEKEKFARILDEAVEMLDRELSALQHHKEVNDVHHKVEVLKGMTQTLDPGIKESDQKAQELDAVISRLDRRNR